MILEAIMSAGIWLVDKIAFIKFPSLPDGVMEYVDTLFDYMATGAGVLANYIPFNYCMTLLACILTVDGIILLYHLIMWILNKIPIIDIDR